MSILCELECTLMGNILVLQVRMLVYPQVRNNAQALVHVHFLKAANVYARGLFLAFYGMILHTAIGCSALRGIMVSWEHIPQTYMPLRLNFCHHMFLTIAS